MRHYRNTLNRAGSGPQDRRPARGTPGSGGPRRHLPSAFCILHSAFFLALVLLPGRPAAAAKPAAPERTPVAAVPGAAGSFKDRAGTDHPWKVNAAFALAWDGTPYLPVGITFAPRSLAEPDKPEAWEADQARLAALKRDGVTDVYVQPGRSAAEVPLPAWQRLVDALDGECFRYGIALPVARPRPAGGWYVRGRSFRMGPFSDAEEHSLEIRIPGLSDAGITRVACTIMDPSVEIGKLYRVEWARLEPIPGGVRASVRYDGAAKGVPYVVEMMPLLKSADGLPDFWQGFGDSRDSLLPLAQLKFGPGLRFFGHPFSGAVDLDGSAGYVLPNSDAYRVEFEAFLERRYRTIETLRNRWSFWGDVPPSLEVAARLVPLGLSTYRSREVGYLLDVKELRCYTIYPKDSAYWYDNLYFREDSLRGHMNQMAQFLREQMADVPIVVQRAGALRYFDVNDRAAGGFVGIGIRADAAHVVTEAGLALGAARMAATRPWCLALGVERLDTKGSLFGAIDTLRQMGVKGWFAAPAGDDPGEIPAWLAEYRRGIEADPQAPEALPRYVLYPHSIRETGGFGTAHPPTDFETRQLAAGLWWIPTLSAWQNLDIGPEMRAFSFPSNDGDEIYIWSVTGKKRIHLRPRTFAIVEVRDIAGKMVRRQKDTDRLRLDLTEMPLVITGMFAHQVAPIEVAKAELEEFGRLTRLDGIDPGELNEYRRIASMARGLDPDRYPREIRSLLRQPLQALRKRVQPAGE